MEHLTNQSITSMSEGDKVVLGLRPKQNPTTGNRRAALPRDAVESTVSKPQNTGHKGTQNNAPIPVVPASAIRVAKIGGTIALAAAAAISAQSLISLGHLLGLHGRVAWLLPTSLDVYAATSIWVGYRIPAAHPASAIARRGACLALILSVCCNALYHLLLLAGHQLPTWLTDGLLVLVGALPPLVVERIFHLQMAVRNGNEEAVMAVTAEPRDGSGSERETAVEATPTPAVKTAARPPAAAPATTSPAATGNGERGSEGSATGNGNGKKPATVVSIDAAGRRSAVDWAELALPLWKRYTDTHGGDAPTAPVLANLLRNAHPDLPIPGSPRSERNIRAAVEDLLDGADEESERAESVS